MHRLKLGKLPARPRPRDFQLSEVAPGLPEPLTSKWGFGHMFSNWGMLGNDNYGDCVFAGAAHETMLYNQWAKTPVDFEDKEVLSDYGAVTGFDPNTGANDNGTDVHQAMEYRRTTGIADMNGNRHKIDAYVSIPSKDWDEMIRALWSFGVVGIGFEFPESAWGQFDHNSAWDVVPLSNIDGGHYVPLVGTLDRTKKVTCITWGRRQEMTRQFYETYNDEAWVPLSLEAVKKGGLSFHAVDIQKLEQLLSGL